MKKYFGDLDLTTNQMKILTRLQQGPLSLIQLACNNHKNVSVTLQSLKWLTLKGLVDVSVKNTKKRYKTLYFLTDKGHEIVNLDLQLQKEKNGPLYKKTFFLSGSEFNSKKQVVKYITDFLSTYSEGDFLTTTHHKFILDCLRTTEWGLDLINSIYKIKIVRVPDLLSLVNSEDSEHIIRVNGLFADMIQYHRGEVKIAFRTAARTEPHIKGMCRYHQGKSLNELMTKFLESKHLTIDEICVHRENTYPIITDEKLRDDWIAFHHDNAEIILLPEDEMIEMDAQKYAMKSIISKCQAEFDKYNVGVNSQ